MGNGSPFLDTAAVAPQREPDTWSKGHFGLSHGRYRRGQSPGAFLRARRGKMRFLELFRHRDVLMVGVAITDSNR